MGFRQTISFGTLKAVTSDTMKISKTEKGIEKSLATKDMKKVAKAKRPNFKQIKKCNVSESLRENVKQKRPYKKRNEKHNSVDAFMRDVEKPQKAVIDSFELVVCSLQNAVTMLSLALLVFTKSERGHETNASDHLTKKANEQDE